jgi:hypothetical protein
LQLPLDYTWQIVSDRVQQFGDLESVEMVSQGVAKIRFMQMKDAERAKNTLHGTTVEGLLIASRIFSRFADKNFLVKNFFKKIHAKI